MQSLFGHVYVASHVKRIKASAAASATCVLVLSLCTLAYGQGAARFEGEIRTKWLSDGRKMELLDDFTYVDAAGKKWRAKKGSVIDGATIPQVFWDTGGPYEGRHRDASVIHDFYCDPPHVGHFDLQHEQRDDDGEDAVAQGLHPSTANVLRRCVLALARHGSPWVAASRDSPTLAILIPQVTTTATGASAGVFITAPGLRRRVVRRRHPSTAVGL